ncbi:cinnamoyl-CoA reductase 1 isoform X2 [Brassica rapa]|uniref:cinnamoyl-CoA reductase 1 isoform X2 n=1 Tax=Brassica campestris TaxID=3711 RepID=UPI0004F18EB4|nr:cinnamoyl-CoA reductase 1 isoform X2 [Brassica rapa]
MNGEGKVVCVTGASGYIASWIVKLLLQRGYTVRATVRDPNNQKKTDHLLQLDGAKERLSLFGANLLEEGSFQHAIDGCEAVFHTASPVLLTAEDPQAELIEPAVKGTLNVLKTCVKMSSVKRVILTSSMAAVIAHASPTGPNGVVDETMFSDPSFCEQRKQWYALSKTLAEDEACVVVELTKGKDPFMSKSYRFVDVRDVSLAHIKALETPSANGRYIIDGPVIATLKDIEKVLREFVPDLCIGDDKNNEDIDLDLVTYKVSVEKVRSLGIEFTPTETSLRDTVLSLKEKCLL